LALRATPLSRAKALHLRGGNGKIEIARRRDERGYTYNTLDFLYKIDTLTIGPAKEVAVKASV
jgi:hypothetical protein